MKELDRRIAIEVMGEPEPSMPSKEVISDAYADAHDNLLHYSEGGNWHLWYVGGRGKMGWVPNSFSTSLDLAMRAVDKYVEDTGLDSIPNDFLVMSYGLYGPPADKLWQCHFSYPRTASGKTLPEAICRLLLALGEKE